MAFNSAIAGIGGRHFALTISSDKTSGYNVKNEVQAAYPGVNAGSLANDIIVVTLSAGVAVTQVTSSICFDGGSLHDQASLVIVMGAGATIAGSGGKGGQGGQYFAGPPASATAGAPGLNGGTAINLGCPTVVQGSGLITKGYGGGGGGGGSTVATQGGCGGGGGVPFGAGGLGVGGPESGAAATLTVRGFGGTISGADGGDGGDSGNVAEAGNSPAPFGQPGGAAGSDGKAVELNGFSWSVTGVTVVGAVS